MNAIASLADLPVVTLVTRGDFNSLPVPAWSALAALGGNGFMHPAALAAAAQETGAEIITLSAWIDTRLVGFWALRLRRPRPFLPTQLEALPYDYAFLSTPLLAPLHADAVMAAFLATIADAPDLPDMLWLKDFDAEGPAFAALAALPQTSIRTQSRPVATRDEGIKASGSTRKKLRQQFNRLGALGAVEIVNHREPVPLLAALDTFLALEAASWKGGQGTALSSTPGDAAFARRMLAGLAETGTASIIELRLDDKVLASQVMLYCGPHAFTWKIAFDSAFAKYSPGAILVDRLAEMLLSGDTAMIDSCAVDSGFMGQLFRGRKTTIDLVLSATTRPGLSYRIVAAYHQAYHSVRQLRDRLRARWLRRG
jgi:CelD/BcsL family acetyltransferase involved in cellulose biosynthesis